MHEEELLSYGLTRTETKAYLTLLELGPSRIGVVCARAGIHRRNAYDALKSLVAKSFVFTQERNGRAYYEAADPHRFLDVLDERRAEMTRLLPALLVRRPPASKVRVYTGNAGRKVIFEEKLRAGGEQLVLGAHAMPERASTYLENFHRRRIDKRIRLRMLFSSGDEAVAREYCKRKLVEARILPRRIVPLAINIYRERVALLLEPGSREPLTVLIEDAALAESFTGYFEMLWRISKPAGRL